jgi:hypothetical protein
VAGGCLALMRGGRCAVLSCCGCLGMVGNRKTEVPRAGQRSSIMTSQPSSPELRFDVTC